MLQFTPSKEKQSLQGIGVQEKDKKDIRKLIRKNPWMKDAY